MRTDIDRTLKILAIIILGGVIAYFGWQLLQHVMYPLELFLMAAIVAFVLSPLVDYLHGSGFPRPLAILMVYIGLLGLLSLLGYWLTSPLLNQITNLTNEVPKQANDFQHRLAPRLHDLDTFLQSHGILAKHQTTTDLIKSQASNFLTNAGQTVVNNLTVFLQTSINFIVNTVLVLVIGFYLLLSGEQLKTRLYNLVPESQLSRITFVETTVNEVLGGYLRGQLLMALTIGTMAGVGVYILGMHQYAVVVGVLAGILELVPMLGPWLASMPAVLIAVFSGNPWPLTLWVGLYFALIQQLESNVIGPRITGHAVGLHPLAALMALLVGIELDGILGALLAVPVAGILYVLGMSIYYHLTGRPQPAARRQSVPTGGLLNTLTFSGRMARRGAHAEEEPLWARLRRRRAATGGVVPPRLAAMEQKRDVLLRDKLQQRADADADRRAAREQHALAEQETSLPEAPEAEAVPREEVRVR